MGTRILLVEDEDTLRSIISQVLEEDGHEVVQASSGEQALELFRREPFPLVITDIVMGKMNGLELLSEVKLVNTETLVVVMTSHASLETATEAIRLGAYDFLVKPFEELDLISAVVTRASDRIDLLADNQRLMQRLKSYAEELELLNRKLLGMANVDSLTELYNHRFFRESLDVEVSRSSRYGHFFSLIFIDIDDFKQYNDTHGHLAGDSVLKQVASLLRKGARQSAVVARYGGEEFVIIVPETDKAGTAVYADTIRRSVEEYPFEGRSSQPFGKVTMSLGVATFPDDGDSANALIESADRALYQAKDQGRNTVSCFGPDGSEKARAEDVTEAAMASDN